MAALPITSDSAFARRSSFVNRRPTASVGGAPASSVAKVRTDTGKSGANGGWVRFS